MSLKKYTVILSDGKGQCGLVKLSGEFDGENPVKLHLSPAEIFRTEKGSGTLYVLGDNIAEIALENAISDYKIPILSKSDVVCCVEKDGKYLVGGTGKVPSLKSIQERIRASKKQKESTPNTMAKEAEKAVIKPKTASPQALSSDAESISQNVSFPDVNRAEDTPEQPAFRRSDDADEEAEISARGKRRNTKSSSLFLDDVNYDGTNFYLAVKPQLDELFVCYPEDAVLNSVVPNSHWARVETEDGSHYVVGIVFDGDSAAYICYGVPSSSKQLPPPEIADVCVWLPLDPKQREGSGYWVIYQSAVDGKCR